MWIVSQSSCKKQNERGKQQELWQRSSGSFTRVCVWCRFILPPRFMSEDNSGKGSSDIHTCSLARWSQAPVQPSSLVSHSVWWDLMKQKPILSWLSGLASAAFRTGIHQEMFCLLLSVGLYLYWSCLSVTNGDYVEMIKPLEWKFRIWWKHHQVPVEKEEVCI